MYASQVNTVFVFLNGCKITTNYAEDEDNEEEYVGGLYEASSA
jgi:hypothetical protein